MRHLSAGGSKVTNRSRRLRIILVPHALVPRKSNWRKPPKKEGSTLMCWQTTMTLSIFKTRSPTSSHNTTTLVDLELPYGILHMTHIFHSPAFLCTTVSNLRKEVNSSNRR